MTPELKTELEHAAQAKLWRMGDLSWKLHPGQRLIYRKIKSTKHKRVYLNVSRQWGKSSLLLLFVSELCLQKPGTRVMYWAPYAKDAEDIATNKAQWLFSDCPKDIKPEHKIQDRTFVFHNGSEITFVGANSDRARFARGRTIDVHVVDEAAEVDDLDQLVNDVAMPSTLHTGGCIFLASTPARSPGHASTLMAKRCALDGEGAYFHFTIHDNPMLTTDVIDGYCKEAGGAESTTWRREYLADLNVVDADTAVVPELTQALRDEICQPLERPPYFPWLDLYVAVDPGMDDLTAILYGYWDCIASRFVAERAQLLKRANTRVIAETITATEAELWPGRKPFMRVIDDSGKRVCADLQDQHALSFSPARKDDRDAAINLMRLYVAGRRLRIGPGASLLADQLQYATKNPKTGDLDRTPAHGHFDAVAACWYLVRTVNDHKGRMPIPDGWDRQVGLAYSRPPTKREDPFRKAILKRSPFGGLKRK